MSIRFVDCKDCPCLNFDYEQGRECNLGYNTGYRQVSEVPREFLYLSSDCELVTINTKSGVAFEPIVSKVPPLKLTDDEVEKHA